MGIQFAAVHERNGWRQHPKHTTLEKAISGKDGAKNLLRNLGRAPDRIASHGQVRAVFVWDDDEEEAHGFRLKPGDSLGIEHVRLPVLLLSGFKPGDGPSPMQIEAWFASHLNVGEVDGDADVLGVNPDSAPLSRHATRSPEPRSRAYRYGDKPTWEIVLDAVREFGRPASSAEVGELIASRIPDFVKSNMGPDLSVLSVNCNSRGNHAVNLKPRRTDTGHPYDQLIRRGRGRGVLFDTYKPNIDGVWELADVGDMVLRPRFLGNADLAELDDARDAASTAGMFDPSEDARRRIMAAIVQRDGQPEFRKALLTAYGGACAISGCRVEALLEAAHIIPYKGVHTNLVGNGLLLRSDLHKLFDLHLLCVDSRTRKIRLSAALGNSEYASFNDVPLREPIDPSMAALSEALKHHELRCGWLNLES
ncbi:HNH endonuclease (plasmid) [Variovorax sp. 375MFSha3.1]|uniref:HNH endonuclease n=1 Tax=unclassified Variovorax TaxID=663243 RepID=UPI003AAE3086